LGGRLPEQSTASTEGPDFRHYFRELGTGSQSLRHFLLASALIGHMLNTHLHHFFTKGQANPVVSRVRLRVDDALLGLKKFQAQFSQAMFSLFFGIGRATQSPVFYPSQHDEILSLLDDPQQVSKLMPPVTKRY
jgi:hypothetical protein